MDKEVSVGDPDDFFDIHICGACKTEFNNVDTFLVHKSQCPALAALRTKMLARAASASNTDASGGKLDSNHDVPDSSHLARTTETPLEIQHITSSQHDTVPQTIGVMIQSTPESEIYVKEHMDTPESWDHSKVQTSAPGTVVYISAADVSSFQKQDAQKGDEHTYIQQGQTQLTDPMGYNTGIQPSQEVEYDSKRTEEVGSPRQVDDEVAVSNGILVSTSSNVIVEPGTLISAEIVQQGEQLVVQAEDQESGIDIEGFVYTGETAQTRSQKGHELILAFDDPLCPNKKKYKCTFAACNFVTIYLRDLERHIRVHTGERPFQCPHCPKAFSRGDKLKIHLRAHTGSKPFKCHICEYGAADSSSLRKHLRVHTDERPFTCQICPYASRNSSQLIVHLRTHTGDTPFQCSICNAKFKINSDLKRHHRIHTGEKPYGCELCDYRCSIKGNLKSHIRINHSNENELQCNMCDFVTSSRKLLREHKKIHDSSAPVKCPTCSYACSNNSALKAHMRIHSDDRPFQCPFCSYTSKQSGNVKTHCRKKHPDKILGDRKPGRTVVSYKKGARAVATNTPSPSKNREEKKYGSSLKPNCKKTFNCNICTSSFVREDSLRSHMRQHCKEIAQNLESTALAVLQNFQNSTPGTTNSESVVSTAVSAITQPQVDGIDPEVERVMSGASPTSVCSVNVIQAPIVSHMVQNSLQPLVQQTNDERVHPKRKRPNNRGLQDIAEAAATLSQIPHSATPPRPPSPYQQHQQQQQHQYMVPTSRVHAAPLHPYQEESMTLTHLAPNSDPQMMHHQQYVPQPTQNMQVLQNMYQGLKVVNGKTYMQSDTMVQHIPHHQPQAHHLAHQQPPPRVLSQTSDTGAVNLQVVPPHDVYPVSLVTRDMHYSHLQQPLQQQPQHLHQQQQQPQHLHAAHLQQQQPQQQLNPSIQSQQPQIQIILPSSGFSTQHPGNMTQNIQPSPAQTQVSAPGHPNRQRQVVVQFPDQVATTQPEPHVITLSTSVCQALISQIRMQDSAGNQNTGYQQQDSSSVVVSMEPQDTTASSH